MAQIILDSNNNLIQGDFDNATLNNRTKLQTTTTNATTNVYVVPNGSSTSAGVSVANNSSLTNASKIVMATNGSTDTQIISGVNGSGTYLPLNFYTNNALSMTIDTANNVGIGTASPSSFSTAKLVLNQAADGDILFARGGSTRQVQLGTTSTTGYINTDNISGGLTLNVNATERMRINSSGNVLMGTTSATRNNREKLEVYTTGGEGVLSRVSDLTYSAFITKSLDAGAGTHFIGYWEKSDGTNVGKITHDNSTTSYTTTSDYRLKENVKPMTGALEKVALLNPVTYTWIDTQKEGQGFIAHELQTVIPDAVVGEKDAMRDDGKIEPQSIDTSFMVATLTAAIQEQQTIINELKTRIEALESK